MISQQQVRLNKLIAKLSDERNYCVFCKEEKSVRTGFINAKHDICLKCKLEIADNRRNAEPVELLPDCIIVGHNKDGRPEYSYRKGSK